MTDVSGDAVLERVDAMVERFGVVKTIADQVNLIERYLRLEFEPEPLLVYKPRGPGKGVAMKLGLRIEPEFGETYVAGHDGGLYLEMASEGESSGEHASFRWKDEKARVTAKLGVPDVSAMIFAYQQVRIRGKAIPSPYKGKTTIENADVLSMIHQFGGITTFIDWTFTKKGSFLRVAKNDGRALSISLSLTEEVQVHLYLTTALSVYQLIGGR